MAVTNRTNCSSIALSISIAIRPVELTQISNIKMKHSKNIGYDLLPLRRHVHNFTVQKFVIDLAKWNQTLCGHFLGRMK